MGNRSESDTITVFHEVDERVVLPSLENDLREMFSVSVTKVNSMWKKVRYVFIQYTRQTI